MAPGSAEQISSAQCSVGWRGRDASSCSRRLSGARRVTSPIERGPAARVSRRRSGGCYGDKGATGSRAQSAERSELIPTPRSLSRSGARTPAAICISRVMLNSENSSSTQSCARTKQQQQKPPTAAFKRNQVNLLSSLKSPYVCTHTLPCTWLYIVLKCVITHAFDYLNMNEFPSWFTFISNLTSIKSRHALKPLLCSYTVIRLNSMPRLSPLITRSAWVYIARYI